MRIEWEAPGAASEPRPDTVGEASGPSHGPAPSSRKVGAAALAPGDARHGTLAGYKNHRCRCAACRKANADYSREYDAHHPEIRHAIRTARCPECGGEMSYGNGTGREPERCVDCDLERRKAARLTCGTRAAYYRGCRCRPCTDAAVAYARRYKKPKVAA